jgi:hypothetical protein
MASHSFERFCSLWLTRVKGAFVIENLPIRFKREKTSKYSPGTGTTDIDLISFDPSNGGELSLNECKSNIHSTFLRASKERLLRQLEAQSELADLLPFARHVRPVKKRVFALRLAPGIRKEVPADVEVIEGADFEHQVLDSLIEKIAEDPWIDPRDDVLGSLRILWHFGCLDRRYYLKRTREILEEKPKITAGELRDWLGLVSHKTGFAKTLLAEIREKK